jgi:hypothetical protein
VKLGRSDFKDQGSKFRGGFAVDKKSDPLPSRFSRPGWVTDLDRGVEIVVDVAYLGFRVGNRYG